MEGHPKSGRYAHAEAILGSELVLRLADTKVLLVGAGGIGCELRQSCVYHDCIFYLIPLPAVKNVVLTGFGHITLLDLDTIDLSNLNRQFLFKKKDVKQSKAMVSATLLGLSFGCVQSAPYSRWQLRQLAPLIQTFAFNRFTRTSRNPSSMSSGSTPLTSSSMPSTTSVSGSVLRLLDASRLAANQTRADM